MEFKRSQQRKTYQRSSKNCEINISNFAEVPVEYESVCRLCLEKHEYMSDIFKDDNLVPIIVKIQTLLGLRVCIVYVNLLAKHSLMSSLFTIWV